MNTNSKWFNSTTIPLLVFMALIICLVLSRLKESCVLFPNGEFQSVPMADDRLDPWRFENNLSSDPAKEYEIQNIPATSKPLTEPGQTAGERRKYSLEGTDLYFRWCPAGEFTMGYDNPFYKPHQVRLTHGFWMLESEVTQKVWKKVMKNNPSYFSETGTGANDVKGLDTDDFPAESMTWFEAVEFCEKLSSLAGLEKTPFTLPTQAQWEYACRAGTLYNFGSSGLVDERMWFLTNSNERTHRVCTKLPNEWGLYDMQGNVFEMCSDRTKNTPQKNISYEDLQKIVYPAVTVDPVGESSGESSGESFGKYRFMRGGSYGSQPRDGQPGQPIFCNPTKGTSIAGLRIILVL